MTNLACEVSAATAVAQLAWPGRGLRRRSLPTSGARKVSNVLAVPVGALLAQAPGGYVVEVVGPGSTRRWVPVRPGMFDDADGLVQVTGNLTPGQHVVVAAS